MVWHIFKKDFRLLWPLSLAVVLVGALNALRTPFDGYFYGSELENLTTFLPRLVAIGIALVAIIVVHQDAVSESQDDWLVRPLLQRHMVLAKVLFVLLTVNAPLMIIDVVVQLALHFPLSVSVGVAVVRSLFLVLMLSLPALMVGAVTRSLVNTVAFVIASTIGFVLLVAIAASTVPPDVLGFSAPMAAWPLPWTMVGIVAVGSVAALALQYFTRRTLIPRSIGLAAVFAALVMGIFVPASITFAIQQSLRGPPKSDGIRLSFGQSAEAGRSDEGSTLGYEYTSTSKAAVAANAALSAALSASVDRQVEKVGLPLRISGMHPGDILVADRIDVRLMSISGEVIYNGPGVCVRDGSAVSCSTDHLEVWAGSANVLDKEALNLPIRIYQRIKDQPVRVEVSYALTRFAARSSQTIKAVGGLQAMPELGSCATRVDGDGDEIQMGCLTDVGAPSCAAFIIEDPQTHRRNPELHKCQPYYGPYRRSGVLKDAIDRVQASIPFHDLSGLAHYPVDNAEIAHALVRVTVYDPVAHFRTNVTVPNVRLADWAPTKVESSPLARN